MGKILFLDIDGVLNDHPICTIYDSCSTQPFCIERINFIVQETKCKIIVISSWKDSHNWDTVLEILYSRGITMNSILGCSTKNVSKEKGIIEFLNKNAITKFVVIDDEPHITNSEILQYCIKPNRFTGISDNDMVKAIEI